jgi:glycosyltransferase involved in cell wall biosynthesis
VLALRERRKRNFVSTNALGEVSTIKAQVDTPVAKPTAPVHRTTVAHVVGTLRDGGAEALLRGLLPRLAAKPDLDMHVVSVYDPRLTADERAALGATLHVVGRRGRGDLGFAPRLLATLRAIRPDIVHGHIHTGKYAGRIAAIAAGVPKIVFTEHGDEAGGALRWAAKRVLNARTNKFIVFTPDERREYALAESIPETRIAVIPNGIPLPAPVDVGAARRDLGLSGNDIALVTAARLVHQKNQALALRALAQLHAAGRGDTRLFVIGDGPDRSALEALAAELGVAPAVRFLGYRNDAAQLVAACDLMLLPSRWEKMPLVLGEAMLAGIPVVSAPWTGVDAFVRDGITGFVSADWTVDAFAAAVESAVENPGLRRLVAAGATEIARERFDLQRTADTHAELYRELARARS